MNEDRLIVGEEYFLDDGCTDTGVFIKKEFYKGKDVIFFLRGKGIGYYECPNGLIGFPIVNRDYKKVQDEI